MDRTVNVRGTGRYSQKPDLITINMTLESREKEYAAVNEAAAEAAESLRAAAEKAGFKKEDIKTAAFTVDTWYEQQQSKTGSYQNVFMGYQISHELSLEFDLDMDKLSRLLGELSKSAAKPRFSIGFSIKDKSGAHRALLESACDDALSGAKILAKASGAKLGKLINICYDAGRARFASPTRFSMADAAPMMLAKNVAANIEPDDVELSENVSFTWELL